MIIAQVPTHLTLNARKGQGSVTLGLTEPWEALFRGLTKVRETQRHRDREPGGLYQQGAFYHISHKEERVLSRAPRVSWLTVAFRDPCI